MNNEIDNILDMEIFEAQVQPGKYSAVIDSIFVGDGRDINNEPCKLLVIKMGLTAYDMHPIDRIQINQAMMWKIKELGRALGLEMPYTIGDLCRAGTGKRVQVILHESPETPGLMNPAHYSKYHLTMD